MSEIIQSTTNNFVYNVHEGESLLGQVGKVICIILPRGFLVAGFSERGDLLMIRYKDYDKSLPTWIIDFYEHHFIDEPLLSQPQAVVATFIGSDKYLITPNKLYEEHAARKWMDSLFFIEDSDIIATHHLHEDQAQYIYAFPGPIKGLATRYFNDTKVLPLPAYQFTQHQKSDIGIHCCITPEQVFATLYQNKILQWHQVFSYQTGEDIAYHISLLCKQKNIRSEALDIECSLIHSGLNPILGNLSQYFPNIRQSEGGMMSTNRQWMPTISLLQRLYVCAL